MGSGLQKQMNPETAFKEGSMEFAPFVRTPLTDITAPLMHCDYLHPCKSYEANYLDCQEAYGNIKGVQACKFYYEDFMECLYSKKQAKRMELMMKERWKQYVKGQLGLGPEVERYAEPPKMHSWGPDNLDND